MAFITWAGKTNVTEGSNSKLTKTGGTVGAWDAGAYSAESVASGAIKVLTRAENTTGVRMIGISNVSDAQANAGYANIDFAVFLYSDGNIYRSENSTVNFITSYNVNDIIGVEVSADGKVNYLKNGVAIYTHNTPILNYPLCADCSLESNNATLADCEIVIPATVVDDTLDCEILLDADLSDDLSEANADDVLDCEILLDASISDEVQSQFTDDEIEFNLFLTADFAASVQYNNSIDFGLNLDLQLNDSLRLNLVDPEPIIVTVSGTDFKQTLKARLYIDDVETPIISARWSKPRENLGSFLNIVLADTKLSTIPSNATFKFQIGERTNLGWDWTTILDNGKLESLNLTRAWGTKAPNDSLSFSTLSPLEDKFALAPRKNIICFDSTRTNVDVSEVETINALNGSNIITEARPLPSLSLYNLLQTAFVEISGFDEIETDLPNYPILRGTFSYQESAKNSVSPFIGIFRPHFIPLPDNKLRILKGTKSIDSDLLTEIEITPDDYENLSLQSRQKTFADGITIQYQANSLYGSDREETVQKTIPNGNFGEPNFTETEITQKWKIWEDEDNNLLDKKLISEVKTKYKGATVIEEIIEEHFYNGQGLEEELRKSRRAWILQLNGEFGLIDVKESIKENFYKTDPFNPGRTYLSRSVTHTSGLYTIDSENQQLGHDVKRDYELVADSANLVDGMTFDTGPLQTLIEDFIPIGNGQVRVNVSGTNHLTDAPLEDFSEIRAGDITLNGAVSRQLEMVIWKDGINTERGRPPIPFNIGELPLFFGIPLAEVVLENNDRNLFEGNINVLGFNKNLDRGQYFKGKGRGNENLGKYIVDGFELEMSNLGSSSQKFTTNLQVSEV